MWTFLHSKYGGSEIKRYSISLTTWSFQIDLRLKQIPLVVLPVKRLAQGGDQLAQLETVFNVQLSKKKQYLDLKRRIADCLNA